MAELYWGTTGAFVEFQLPLTLRRLDSMATSHDRSSGRPAAVVAENQLDRNEQRFLAGDVKGRAIVLARRP